VGAGKGSTLGAGQNGERGKKRPEHKGLGGKAGTSEGGGGVRQEKSSVLTGKGEKIKREEDWRTKETRGLVWSSGAGKRRRVQLRKKTEGGGKYGGAGLPLCGSKGGRGCSFRWRRNEGLMGKKKDGNYGEPAKLTTQAKTGKREPHG